MSFVNRKTISFASFNLLNLNEPGQRIYNDRDGWPADIFARKVEWSADVLRRMPADVFGFQELWDTRSLQSVVDAAGLGDSYAVLSPQDHRGQMIVNAAAVDRELLVGEPQWIKDFPQEFILQSSGDDAQTDDIDVRIATFSRPVLRFQIRPRENVAPISVYVCHFKSKAPTRIFREGWYRDNDEFYKRHSEAIGAGLSTIPPHCRGDSVAHDPDRRDEGHRYARGRPWRLQ